MTGMDRFGTLNVFVRVAESSSFTAAGRDLGISSSGIGKAIARLEERLGVRLFHRSTRSISLTPEGVLFLRRCQTILGEIDAAETELTQTTTEPRGKLRVSLPLIGMLLMPAVSSFAIAYPEIDLDLDFSDRLVDVIQDGFDVVLRTGRPGNSQLRMRKLGTYSYVIVGSPAYLAKWGVPKAPEDLDRHACLLHRWSATGKAQQWLFSHDGADMEYEPPVSTVANTMEPLIDLAEHGAGLIYTPTFTVREQLADGRLQSVLDTYVRGTGSLQALWPANRHQSPKVRAFVAFMARNLLVSRP